MVSERRTLGERLKRQRERRGVTLESISQATKVPISLFAGLERGDCSRWPAGLYSRAYVRSYAQAIGLNPDETVEDFVAAFGASLQADPLEGALPPPRRGSGLRLTMVDEAGVDPMQIVRRASLAATDVAIAVALAWTAYAWLDAGALATVGSVVGYQGLTRLVSDEPLPWWIVRRIRTAAARPEAAPTPEEPREVAVADAASTTA